MRLSVDPHRRDQRQGVGCGDVRRGIAGGRAAHRALHVPPLVRLPRAHPDRRPPGRAGCHDGGGGRAARGRRPDRTHLLRGDHRSGVRCIRRSGNRHRGGGGRAGWASRRDQRDRPGSDLHHQRVTRPRGLPGHHRGGHCPGEGRDHQAGCPGAYQRDRRTRPGHSEGRGEAGRRSLPRARSGQGRAKPGALGGGHELSHVFRHLGGARSVGAPGGRAPGDQRGASRRGRWSRFRRTCGPLGRRSCGAWRG